MQELKQAVRDSNGKAVRMMLAVVEALEAADLVGPGKRGLGFGIEPLVAYFASPGCEIVATDFEHGWYENSFARLIDRRICPRIPKATGSWSLGTGPSTGSVFAPLALEPWKRLANAPPKKL
ncbi:MAG: hypothetical protein R3C99_21055 [Pirellulaceae bacterium]